MDIETITKFIDAGYTKADIEAMQKDIAGTETKNNETATTTEEQTKTRETDAGEVTKAGIDPAEAISALTETVNELTKTVKAMQAANAKAANIASNDIKDPIKTAMDSFIDSL